MKRIKIFKAYFVLWLFVYFIVVSNIEVVSLYFLSTLTFNIAIVTLLAIGTFMLLKGAKDLVMIAGTFGVLMYKKKNLSFYIKDVEKILPGNVAKKLKARAEGDMLLFTQLEKEEILSWIEEKFSNQNKYNNFFIGTVLMIGLLGTFSGLLGAISDMGNIVMSLAGASVDVGKIMAKFSGPLSSMAVGFGSSLFGVISAILLSIKGYLLNKSQATLIDGVENWLNERTVDTISQSESSVSVSENIKEHQPSFMDIFTEQLGSLTKEIKNLNQNSTLFNDEFINSIRLLQKTQQIQSELLLNVAKSLKSIEKQSNLNKDQIINTLTQNHNEQQRIFEAIFNMQKDHMREFVNLNTSVEDIGYILNNNQLNFKTVKTNSSKSKTKENNQKYKIDKSKFKQNSEKSFELNTQKDFLEKHFENKNKFKFFRAEV